MPIRKQLKELLDSANTLRATAERQLGALLPEQIAWKPAPDRWSIAQTLDHLNKSAAAILPRFDEVLRTGTAARHEREETIRAGLLDRMFLRVVSVNPPVKVPVPPMLLPDPVPDPTMVVREFFRLHDALEALIVRSDDFRLRELNIESPVHPNLKPSFMSYLTGTITHEQYHWKQIETILAEPGFPK